MKKYFQAPWEIKDVIIISIIIATLMVGIKIGVNMASIELTMIEGLVLQWSAMLAPALIYTSIKYKVRKKTFGIKKVGIKKTIITIAKGYGIYLSIMTLLLTVVLYLNIKIPGFQVQKPIIENLAKTTPQLIGGGIAIVIIAPIIEELIFRGLIFRTLANKIGIGWGSAISAGLFALLHVNIGGMVQVFILALVMNYLVIRTKSITTSIIFHMLQNGMAFAIGIIIIKYKLVI